MSKETYFSVDVEADGPIPGPHSMLSLGCASFDDQGNHLNSFEINLQTLPGATMHPKTKEFWDKNPEAWKHCRQDPQEPHFAMRKFNGWITQHKKPYCCVGYPVAWDFMYVYWYFMNFLDYSPFSHSALDIKTLAMVGLARPYRQSTKRNMPKGWFKPGLPHTHKALDDAVEQGYLFFNVLDAIRDDIFDG